MCMVLKSRTRVSGTRALAPAWAIAKAVFDSDKYRMEHMQLEDPANPLVHAILHKDI